MHNKNNFVRSTFDNKDLVNYNLLKPPIKEDCKHILLNYQQRQSLWNLCQQYLGIYHA